MSAAQARRNTNPFPGLRPFHESEQHLFFGRESQIDAMVDKLAANRFLAVVGTSGSGKSSLVNCGLRPALHTGLMANAGTVWRIAQCRPGGDPIAALSTALSEDGVLLTNYQDQGLTLHEIVDTTLRMGKLGLVDMVQQAQLSEGCNLLLVVDQFEELFRYQNLGEHSADKSAEIGQQAAAFVNLLLTAIEQSVLPIYIVITMRSDFLGDCAQFPGLAEAINQGQYLVPRMTREQRRAAIAGPIGVGNGKIHQALLTRLVNDVGTNPDQLSILQHALNRTWSCWENERGRQGMLDLDCYESIGSMTSALDQHANEAFSELDTERKKIICETLFKALTDKASDARGVRRPTRLDTLCEMCGASVPELVSVIDIFRKPSRSFLMPPDDVQLQPDTVIDISHESLMRVWKILDIWADQEADSARMYQRWASSSELYKEENALLRDPYLRIALKWREQNKPNAIWASQYNTDFDSTMSFLKRSEKSDLLRKRLRGGSIAAVFTILSGYLAYASYDKITVLSDEKEQALHELDEAEQEKIEALNEVEQAKNEVLNQVEDSKQKVVVDIEENLTRILTEEAEQAQQVSPARGSESANTSVAAKEQIQFFDAISVLTESEKEIIVEHIAVLESEHDDFQVKYSEQLAHYQKLKVQKKIQCELNSVGEQNEQPLDDLQREYCDQSASDDPMTIALNRDSNVTPVDCKQDAISDTMLAKLGEQERAMIDNRVEQLTCDVATLDEKMTKLSIANSRLQNELDHLRGRAIAPAVPSVVISPANEVAEVSAPAHAISIEQAVEPSAPINIKLFQACESVKDLEPSGCKSENEFFSPGKIFVFARIVTETADDRFTLRWFRNGANQPFSEKLFTVQPNPNGYRTYTWNTLDRGAYEVCLFNQSDQVLKCIGIGVGQPDTQAKQIIGPEPLAESEKNAQIETGASISLELQAVAEPQKIEEISSANSAQIRESTRLEDSEDDGFVVCKDVVKLEPEQCGSELSPGRVYAFARIVTPYELETVTLQWFREGVEIQELRKELEIRKNNDGYRTYSWNTFDSGSYSVSLSDQQGEELRVISFDVK